MLFSSYIFILLFLPVTVAVYFLLNKYVSRNEVSLGFLTIASLIFYGYNNVFYVPVIVVSILVNYFLSRMFYRENVKHKKAVLIAGLVIDIGVIFYFKYFDFFISNINALLKTDFTLMNIMLPLGISFFTFQQISFLVDSYRGETEDYNFIEYATFVSYFPQLVAGPIVLHNEIIPQFRNAEKKRFNTDNLVWGIQLFVFGLFKKAIIADNFSRVVDAGFGSFDSMTSGDIICVMLCYTFQIYFDFSGYSDMATGICRMMNIELPMNFDSPYKSVSIRDFWKRWHLTLTRFLTKYVYFPLGGSRKGTVRTCINVMIVFALSGLWHGANWTFILWGLINGALSVLERLLEKYYNRLSTALQWLYSFTTVNILWFLFRSDSITMWAKGMGHLLKFENMNVSDFIIDAFYVKENDFIYTILGLGNAYGYVRGFTMITTILIALIICLGFENNYRRQWKSSVVTMIVTPFMLLWSLLSLSSEAVFIYFNF